MADPNGYYYRLKRRLVGFPRWARLVTGVLLVGGGVLGFLPILGFWMVPLGLIVLSTDIPAVRKFNRRATVAVVGWWKSRKTKEERKASRNGRPS